MSSTLAELEAQLATLPAGSTKHDMASGFEVMAEWIQGLDRESREKVLAELPRWLHEDHPWHSQAAMEIALRLRDPGILEAAAQEAARRGIRDLPGGEDYPPWLIFHLNLMSTISRWQGALGERAKTYLRELRMEAQGAKSHSRRLLSIRAWFTECAIEGRETRRPCLIEGLEMLRSWNDEGLARSALSLLHAYFASSVEGVSDLRTVLTPDEFAIACPEAVTR